MKLATLLIVGLLLVSSSKSLLAQEAPYVPEKDRQALKKLDDWQNMKFGLLMHWGPYSQWGIVESGRSVLRMSTGVVARRVLAMSIM